MIGSQAHFRLRSLAHLLIPAVALVLLFGLTACQPEAGAEGDADADGEVEAPYGSAFLAPLGPETDMEDLHEYGFGGNLHSIDFLGGVLLIPPGQTGYATVNLESGRYAWVFPRFGEEDILVEEFTVE